MSDKIVHTILKYTRETLPEIAKENNSEWVVKAIREEIEAELLSLKVCKDLFLAVEMVEETKRCYEEMKELMA